MESDAGAGCRERLPRSDRATAPGREPEPDRNQPRGYGRDGREMSENWRYLGWDPAPARTQASGPHSQDPAAYSRRSTFIGNLHTAIVAHVNDLLPFHPCLVVGPGRLTGLLCRATGRRPDRAWLCAPIQQPGSASKACIQQGDVLRLPRRGRSTHDSQDLNATRAHPRLPQARQAQSRPDLMARLAQ